MMTYWLLKTEPSDYSYDDLEAEPAGTVWDGVRNNTALQYLRDMKKGDRAIVYHTGNVRAAVGVAEITSDPYPDPRGDDERFAVVDVAADFRLDEPVPLADLRDDERFADHPLIRNSRLSAMDLTPEIWEEILRRGGAP
jgi:predicted RNA-binding protein with PUA-like domain